MKGTYRLMSSIEAAAMSDHYSNKIGSGYWFQPDQSEGFWVSEGSLTLDILFSEYNQED